MFFCPSNEIVCNTNIEAARFISENIYVVTFYFRSLLNKLPPRASLGRDMLKIFVGHGFRLYVVDPRLHGVLLEELFSHLRRKA